MKLRNILITVKDIDRSVSFYKELFGLKVRLYQDGNVILTEGLVLQDAALWQQEIGREILPQNNASLLYFEEPNLEAFVEKLERWSGSKQGRIEYVTHLTILPWGQKIVRFYDPDGNLIEVRTPVRANGSL